MMTSTLEKLALKLAESEASAATKALIEKDKARARDALANIDSFIARTFSTEEAPTVWEDSE